MHKMHLQAAVDVLDMLDYTTWVSTYYIFRNVISEIYDLVNKFKIGFDILPNLFRFGMFLRKAYEYLFWRKKRMSVTRGCYS